METIIPQNCPSCGTLMRVRALQCPSCATEVQGDYTQDVLMRLTPEQRIFLLTFIRCSGSLKDLGQTLGISYPTARARLDALVQALDQEYTVPRTTRMDVLNKLKNGEITVDEAVAIMKGE